MKRLLLFICLISAGYGFGAEISVFDMPRVTPTHNQLLELMNIAHQKKDYQGMAAAANAGLSLGIENTLWLYNLACAENLLGHQEKALDLLEKSVKDNFMPVDDIRKDPDLKSLIGNPRFEAFLAKLKDVKNERKILPPIVKDSNDLFVQNATNTVWNTTLGLFTSPLEVPDQKAPYQGLFSEKLNQWAREGTADVNVPIVYVNRDRNMTKLSGEKYPSLMHLGYDIEMVRRELDAGLPNTFFADSNGHFLPALGNASSRSRIQLGATAFSTSFSLFAAFGQETMAAQTMLLLFNQLYFYSAGIDYAGNEDRFYANNPLSITVNGNSGEELQFLETAIAATMAMHPDVREKLIKNSDLGLTLNMLFRASQKGLDKPEDYLTGKAHPVVFLPERLDSEKMINMAHELKKAPPIPPFLNVVEETPSMPGLDFFETRYFNELVYTTPFAVSRVFRGKSPIRQYLLKVNPEKLEKGSKLNWALLQGDPQRVAFQKIKDNPYAMLVTVAYHPVFKVAQPPKYPEIKTSRVDIAAIVEKDGAYSMPSIMSVYFLPSETREHSKEGEIMSIDYTRSQDLFQIPTLSDPKQWKDTFNYTASGDYTGWTRTRGNSKEEFSPHGLKVVTRDGKNRADKAHFVKYVPRYTSSAQNQSQTVLDIAEVDDQDTLFYSYKSDKDLIGKPLQKKEENNKGK